MTFEDNASFQGMYVNVTRYRGSLNNAIFVATNIQRVQIPLYVCKSKKIAKCFFGKI